MYSPPDRPLIVKCTFDKWHKRVTFNSARNCSYDVLCRKVEQCFALYGISYAVTYKDDDGEITNIATDEDLIEAIQYFQVGDDAPLSSAASILSGRSFGPRKITVRVNIIVEGPSLSDTSSLASLDDFKSRNGSQQSFSFGAPSVDDDSVTVSSHDPGTKFRNTSGTLAGSSTSSISHKQSQLSGSEGYDTLNPPNASSSTLLIAQSPSQRGGDFGNGSGPDSSTDAFSLADDVDAAARRYPEDPSAVLERLNMADAMRDDASSVNVETWANNSRGAAWLHEQNERARLILGTLPEPSDSDGFSISLNSQEDSFAGDLALERDDRGRYYYTYTGSAASQVYGSADEEAHPVNGDGDVYVQKMMRGPRPSSMQEAWIKSQQARARSERSNGSASFSDADSIPEEFSTPFPASIESDMLPFLLVTSPPPDILTDCSNCGILLDSIRYVCSTCGEKPPVRDSASQKGKERDDSPSSYPPAPHKLFSSTNSSSSRTYVGSSTSLDSQQDPHRDKPLPLIPSSFASLPTFPSLFGRRSASQSFIPISLQPVGYELCSGCIESAGINHAIEAGLSTPGTSPGTGNTSPEDPQRALQWRRTAPKKGQLRHAYREKVWGTLGWEDVVQDEEQVSKCSTCSAVTPHKRYQCASCSKIHLCRACYSQVHETHPSHAFIIVPDKPVASAATSETFVEALPDSHEEISLKHPGVKCAHCLRDIVGARFHCAICDAVDICSNCESAGLPGNLDSADGGHNSSHILIKIPYPLETTELENASRRALHLWTGRDAASVGLPVPRSRANSEISGYAQTMIGTHPRSRRNPDADEHRTLCDSCGNLIFGARYQCGHCPSAPTPYSLCAACETKSYQVHDPMHVFFKLPRPVYTPLESPYPMLPQLYKIPAGPPPGSPKTTDPKAYLSSLVNHQAICDRCIRPIQGEWFRCCYCPLDLCDMCEEVDTHNQTHVFLVFKSLVDMHLFKSFAKPDNPNGPPVIPYPIYR